MHQVEQDQYHANPHPLLKIHFLVQNPKLAHFNLSVEFGERELEMDSEDTYTLNTYLGLLLLL